MSERAPRERLARTRAAEVLAEHGIVTYPISPERIATAFQFPLPIDETDGFPKNTYGALYKDGNDFRILVSRSCPTDGHRRFTLAHELGHFYLDDHLTALFDRGATAHLSDTSHFRGFKKAWYELEADAFASELLVPASMARPFLTRAPGGLGGVQALSAAFVCSLSCAAIRFAALTNDPFVAIISNHEAVEWAAYSSPMMEHSFSRKRVRGEWAPKGSATLSLARDAASILDCVIRKHEGLLSEWFEDAPDVVVSEEAVGLGTYGRILTVLCCDVLPSPEALATRKERLDRGPSDWRGAMRDWNWDSYEDEDE